MLLSWKDETKALPIAPPGNQSERSGRTLQLVRKGARARPAQAYASLGTIFARRCSGFLGEAAVLVLVFGLLDCLLQRGRLDAVWVFGSLLISLSLLVASVATEFMTRRWLGVFP